MTIYNSRILMALAIRGSFISNLPFDEGKLSEDELQSVYAAKKLGNDEIKKIKERIKTALEIISAETADMVKLSVAMEHAKATGNYLPVMVMAGHIQKPTSDHPNIELYQYEPNNE